jgi:anti-anti-sigma regulatory factor
MDCDQLRISYSVEPSHCVLLLEGALGVAQAEELRSTAQEVCGCGKDVSIDWSGATQIDAGVAQVLLTLRSALAENQRSLAARGEIPPAIQSWLSTAGLSGLLGTPGRPA